MPVEPRVLIAVGGITVPGAVSLELTSVGYAAADRFSAAIALAPDAGTSMAFVATLAGQRLTISVAVDGAGVSPLLVGQIDNVRIDLVKNVAVLSGRDLTALLLDTEISDAFVNQTASQIATAVAEGHGLTPVVTSTSTLVGQYYERDHARSALGLNARATTQWNLLVALARIEGYRVGVSGQTLVFGPATATAPVAMTVNDFSRLALDYAATLPSATTVLSWNSRNKAAYQSSVGSGAPTSLVRPNLSLAAAQSLAASHTASMAGQALMLSGVMPGETQLAAGSLLRLSGTNSLFDTVFVVMALRRSVTAGRGFWQAVRACAAAA